MMSTSALDGILAVALKKSFLLTHTCIRSTHREYTCTHMRTYTHMHARTHAHAHTPTQTHTTHTDREFDPLGNNKLPGYATC